MTAKEIKIAPQQKILLAHGSGGRLTHKLIRDVFLKSLNNPILSELSDSAKIDYKEKIAFTTDSFVVSPLFFPGGDIGKLSVCGTINDLVMVGAVPEYLSLGLIIEEGLDREVLEKIINSISLHAKRAGVVIVTGDTKVVENGAADKVFINTSGVGRIINKGISINNIKCGDKIILTGNIAEHGLAVLTKRKDLDLGLSIKSDCAALNNLIVPLLRRTKAIKFMRDPTRGGIATTLNEITESSGLGIIIEEKNIPITSKVRVVSELLGIDPLYIANEGIAIMIVGKDSAKGVLNFLRRHPLGCHAQIVGEVVKQPKGRVILKTTLGTERIVDMLTAESLPRIC